jgi:NAD(P)-dependent dehydrogenase (short-subunit alcohol dehydrogenase family)
VTAPGAGADPSAVPDYLGLLRMDGRLVIVLGAGAGIGRQAAHALAQAGAAVWCVDRDAELAAAVAAEVGGRAEAADVTRRDDMERVFSAAASTGQPVSGVVDVVGIAATGPLADTDDATFDSQLSLVLRHAYLALQIGGRVLSAAGGGSMVLVGSMSGLAYSPGQSVYGAAKAALHHLVKSAGREFAAANVRVNAVAPGLTRTPRLEQKLDPSLWKAAGRHIPRGHAGTPAEIAAPILFLMSELSSYITGQIIAVDGATAGNIPDLFAV